MVKQLCEQYMPTPTQECNRKYSRHCFCLALIRYEVESQNANSLCKSLKSHSCPQVESEPSDSMAAVPTASRMNGRRQEGGQRRKTGGLRV